MTSETIAFVAIGIILLGGVGIFLWVRWRDRRSFGEWLGDLVQLFLKMDRSNEYRMVA
jgi:LPXTG-motif cell wall-anchored protein